VYGAVIDRYCTACHNERLRTANLVLESGEASLHQLAGDAARWERVALKLRARSMPPPGSPRPAPEVYAGFASWLEGALDDLATDRPNPGRPPIRRLNRTEYANVIRDLLDLELDVQSLLPADDLAYGFDNNAAALKVTPGLLDRYLAAATRISRIAVGDRTIQPTVEHFTVSPLYRQDDRLSEAQPFGLRGGLALRHHFPLDAEYVLRVRLLPNTLRRANGQVDVRLDGERVELFTIGSAPAAGGPKMGDNGVLEVRLSVKAGSRSVAVGLVRKQSAPDGLGPARMPVGSVSFRDSGVAALEIDGPFNSTGPGDTPSRRRIFVCTEPKRACAGEIVATLARRAYRRPITRADRDALLAVYDLGQAAGGFDQGIQRAVARILMDPEFLFRVERDPADVVVGRPYRLSDLELASRLSFFLWSSIPDEELLGVAERGQLSEPAVLERQVRRMLIDAKASTLVSSFAAQWLHLRNVRAVTPDGREFPDFDNNLREAFTRETELLLESQLREDRGVAELLTADYTFVNERLARHYGIPNVYGSRFRRVAVTDEARQGLLGHGSILTVTSYPNRTSPVLRGKWLLENIFGTPPPPPPPDVPALEEASESAQPRSVRERMEEHRRNPVCASCHRSMDPLGFALENFDAIGKWRATTEAGTPVDVSGVLPDGTAIDGPVGLRSVIQARSGEFIGTVTGKLLTYAIGRGLEHDDAPAVRAIVRQAGPDYRWSSIVLGIVKSPPFQMRIRREP
jgi:hypothetical protein